MLGFGAIAELAYAEQPASVSDGVPHGYLVQRGKHPQWRRVNCEWTTRKKHEEKAPSQAPIPIEAVFASGLSFEQLAKMPDDQYAELVQS